MYLDHRRVFKQLFAQFTRDWLDVFFTKFLSKDFSHSQALCIFEPTNVGASVNWNGCFKARTMVLNRRLSGLPLFFEVIFNNEASEVRDPEVKHFDKGLLLCEVIKANGRQLRSPAFKVVHKRLLMLVKLHVLSRALVCECLSQLWAEHILVLEVVQLLEPQDCVY